MKLKTFLITGLAIVSILTPLKTNAATDENKTIFTSQEVTIAEEIFDEGAVPFLDCTLTYISVKNEKNEQLFSAYPKDDLVYTTQEVNLRVAPSIKNRRYATIPRNAEIQRIGKSDAGWDIIKVGDKTCFIWNEFITEEKPREEIIEINAETIQNYQEVYLGVYRLTAYCSCVKCCGKWSGLNKTASGATPRAYHTAACNSLPFGTKVRIGDIVYTIEDRGNMAGDIIDIYFDSHEAALNSGFGLIPADVYMVN